MQFVHPSSQQVFSVFGGGFVLERHGDTSHRYLSPAEKHEFFMDFDAVIKALRSALGLNN